MFSGFLNCDTNTPRVQYPPISRPADYGVKGKQCKHKLHAAWCAINRKVFFLEPKNLIPSHRIYETFQLICQLTILVKYQTLQSSWHIKSLPDTLCMNLIGDKYNKFESKSNSWGQGCWILQEGWSLHL